MTCSRKQVSEAAKKAGIVKSANFYNQMAHKVAFEEELKLVDKAIRKAAMKGLTVAKIGVLTADMTFHLNSLGFVVAHDDVDTTIIF